MFGLIIACCTSDHSQFLEGSVCQTNAYSSMLRPLAISVGAWGQCLVSELGFWWLRAFPNLQSLHNERGILLQGNDLQVWQ